MVWFQTFRRRKKEWERERRYRAQARNDMLNETGKYMSFWALLLWLRCLQHDIFSGVSATIVDGAVGLLQETNFLGKDSKHTFYFQRLHHALVAFTDSSRRICFSQFLKLAASCGKPGGTWNICHEDRATTAVLSRIVTGTMLNEPSCSATGLRTMHCYTRHFQRQAASTWRKRSRRGWMGFIKYEIRRQDEKMGREIRL